MYVPIVHGLVIDAARALAAQLQPLPQPPPSGAVHSVAQFAREFAEAHIECIGTHAATARLPYVYALLNSTRCLGLCAVTLPSINPALILPFLPVPPLCRMVCEYAQETVVAPTAARPQPVSAHRLQELWAYLSAQPPEAFVKEGNPWPRASLRLGAAQYFAERMLQIGEAKYAPQSWADAIRCVRGSIGVHALEVRVPVTTTTTTNATTPTAASNTQRPNAPATQPPQPSTWLKVLDVNTSVPLTLVPRVHTCAL